MQVVKSNCCDNPVYTSAERPFGWVCSLCAKKCQATARSYEFWTASPQSDVKLRTLVSKWEARRILLWRVTVFSVSFLMGVAITIFWWAGLFG